MANKKKPVAIKKKVEDKAASHKAKESLATKVARDLNTKFGEGSAMIRGTIEASDMLEIPFWVRTGIPELDYAVGGVNHPGFPAGRIIEIFGAEASGKTSLATWILKVFVEEHGIGLLQDAEHALSEERIEQFGLDMENVIYTQPETLEEVFEQQEATIEAIRASQEDEPMAMVLDSVASCPTKSELEGEYGDSVMGIHARLMSQAMRKIKGVIKKRKIMAIYVNQTRDKIGVTFGDKTSTFGGKALKFYSSVRVEITRIATLKKGDYGVPYGIRVKATVRKNKVAPPFRSAEFEIMFDGRAIDHIGATLEWLKTQKLIGGSQGWYEIGGKNYRLDDARELLSADEDLYDELVELAYTVTEV